MSSIYDFMPSFDERWSLTDSLLNSGNWDRQPQPLSALFGSAPEQTSPPAASPAAPPPAPVPTLAPTVGPTLASTVSPTLAPTLAPTPNMPDSAPATEPSLGDRLHAGFGGLVNSHALIPGLFNLVGGLATGERQDPTGRSQAATLQALTDSGVPPAIAKAATLNPDLLKQIAPQYLGGYKVGQPGASPPGRPLPPQEPDSATPADSGAAEQNDVDPIAPAAPKRRGVAAPALPTGMALPPQTYLRKNPKDQFIAKYGADAYSRIMGRR